MRFWGLFLIFCFTTLSGCGGRGTLALLPEQKLPTRERTVLVATSRSIAPAPDFFGETRSYNANYSKFEISIPPRREIGEVEYPRANNVDPNTQFLVSSVTRLDGKQEFTRAINEEAQQLPSDGRQGFVFVHGFNTNSAEGIIRATALAEDTGREGVEVVYSWPSAGSVLKYLDDRESALFARDAFKQTLSAMSASRLSNYIVVAHSMGTFVTMDTLRELAQENDSATIKKIKAVVLISADLDIDVFRKQAVAVLAKGIPIILLTADDDLALRLSSKMRGQGDRVGDIKTVSDLGGLGVIVFDLTNVDTGDPLKHFKIGSSPEILKFLKSLNQSGQGVIGSASGGRTITVDAEALAAETGVVVTQ